MKPACKKCGTVLEPGVAIAQTWVAGMPDFIGDTSMTCCTMSVGGPGKLIKCLKCPKCGWSVTDGSDQAD